MIRQRVFASARQAPDMLSYLLANVRGVLNFEEQALVESSVILAFVLDHFAVFVKHLQEPPLLV